MRIWTCPECAAAIRAPERPRRDDVRRYCLRCSQRTGRLVERRALAAERRREERASVTAARRKVAATTAKERERAKLTVGGIYLPAEAKRLWNVPTLRGLPGWRKDLPVIEYRQSARKMRSSGVCYGWRIAITLGSDPAGNLATLLHELTHSACGLREHHSPRYWSMLRSAAKEAWPEADWSHFATASDLRHGWQRQRQIEAGIAGLLAQEISQESRPTI